MDLFLHHKKIPCVFRRQSDPTSSVHSETVKKEPDLGAAAAEREREGGGHTERVRERDRNSRGCSKRERERERATEQ